jgi:hypothetical protein
MRGRRRAARFRPSSAISLLDDLDKELARCGHRFCRDADDCNIYVRSRRAGERAVASVSRFLTNKLRLKGNEAKSAVARPEERKFLRFSISNDRAAHRAKGSSASARLREFSRTSKRGSVEDCVCISGGSGDPLRRTMPSRHIEVQRGGGCRLARGHLANVRTPVGPALRNSDFDSLGLPPNLCALPSLTRSNRRGTDPYARWRGRGDAARHPLSRSWEAT